MCRAQVLRPQFVLHWLGCCHPAHCLGCPGRLWQFAFACQVVFQNTRQCPVGAALQQRLSALQRRANPRTRDARQHVVVGRDMGCCQTCRQTRCTSANTARLVDDRDGPSAHGQAVRYGGAGQTRTNDQRVACLWRVAQGVRVCAGRSQINWLLAARSLGPRLRQSQRNGFPSGEPGIGGRADRPGSGGFH